MPQSHEHHVPADAILDEVLSAIGDACEVEDCRIKGAVLTLTFEDRAGDLAYARALKLNKGSRPSDIEYLQKQYTKTGELFDRLEEKINTHQEEGKEFDNGELRKRIDVETGKALLFNSLDQATAWRDIPVTPRGKTRGNDADRWN